VCFLVNLWKQIPGVLGQNCGRGGTAFSVPDSLGQQG